MPILAGQVVTVDDLNHLKATTYMARATSGLTGVVANADVPGATITLDTETDNAVFVAHAVFDVDWQGAATGVVIGLLHVDGSGVNGQALVEQAAGANGDRIGPGQVWRGTLATAGSHTLKLVATVPNANQTIRDVHTAIQVTIHEVV